MKTEKSDILVSVCTLTYNHAPYLEDYFKGILSQKCNFKFEVIINDDCSTDGSQDVLLKYAKEYPDLIKVVIQQENQYSKGNRGFFVRYCFPRCSGKYIAFCEGDDCWIDPYKLQKQVDYLEAHPEYVLSHSDFNEKDVNTGLVKKQVHLRGLNLCATGFDFSISLPQMILCGQYSPLTLTVVARRDMVDSVCSQSSFFKRNDMSMGDTPLWFGLARLGKFHYLHEATAEYHVLTESASHSANFSKVIDFYQNCFKMIDILSLEIPNSRNIANKAKSIYSELMLSLIYCAKVDYLGEVCKKLLWQCGHKSIFTHLFIRTIFFPKKVKEVILLVYKVIAKVQSVLRFYYYKLRVW